MIAKRGSLLDCHKSVIELGLSQTIDCPYSMYWHFSVDLVVNDGVCYKHDWFCIGKEHVPRSSFRNNKTTNNNYIFVIYCIASK